MKRLLLLTLFVSLAYGTAYAGEVVRTLWDTTPIYVNRAAFDRASVKVAHGSFTSEDLFQDILQGHVIVVAKGTLVTILKREGLVCQVEIVNVKDQILSEWTFCEALAK